MGGKVPAFDLRYEDVAPAARVPTEDLPSAEPFRTTFQFGGLDTGYMMPSWLSTALAGAGKRMSDIGTLGMRDVPASDKELMQEPAAMGGAIGADVAAMLTGGKALQQLGQLRRLSALGTAGQALMSPQTALQAAAGPAVYAAATTPGDVFQRGKEGAQAAIGGELGYGLAKGIGKVAEKAQGRVVPGPLANDPLMKTLKEAIDEGYKVPPGQVNPTLKNRMLESTGGKIATQQLVSEQNQKITDKLARRAAGLAADDPITPETLAAARDRIKWPYKEIAKRGYGDALDKLDELRVESRNAWTEYSRTGARAALKDAQENSDLARKLETWIEQQLAKQGKPDLADKFREARVALAKNHDVETALIEGGGSVDARAIGRMFQRGDKMTGELRTIGAFANNFPKSVQPDKLMGTPGAHNLRSILSMVTGGLGGAGGMAAGGPVGGGMGLAMGAGLPWAAEGLARQALLSSGAQRGLTSGMTQTMLPPATQTGVDLLRMFGPSFGAGLLVDTME